MPVMENDYALVVGIRRYPGLKDLQGPVEDAHDFLAWVTGGGGVPRANVQTIISDMPPKPGDRPALEEIDQAFDTLFKQAAKKPARRLYAYFAGHGCSAEPDHLALLMANASMAYLNRAMNAPEYHRGLAKRPLFKEQILFYDCCRNYDRRARGRQPEWTDDAPAAGTEDVKQFIMYAAAFTQFANEKVIDYSERRGLFTKALLEGLRGEAPTRVGGKWVVTTASLVPYVTHRLEELAKQFQLRQKPSLGPGTTDELILTEVQPKLQTVTITGVPDGTVVIVCDDRLSEIVRGTVQGGAVQFDLAFATYQFKVDGQAGGLLKDVKPGELHTWAI
jgi:hypothetical protein